MVVKRLFIKLGKFIFTLFDAKNKHKFCFLLKNNINLHAFTKWMHRIKTNFL